MASSCSELVERSCVSFHHFEMDTFGRQMTQILSDLPLLRSHSLQACLQAHLKLLVCVLQYKQACIDPGIDAGTMSIRLQVCFAFHSAAPFGLPSSYFGRSSTNNPKGASNVDQRCILRSSLLPGQMQLLRDPRRQICVLDCAER